MKRSDQVASSIKTWIHQNNLQPQDRLPQEKELMEQFAASKAVVREALKSLQLQGLIRVKTGPNGGAFLTDTDLKTANSLLSSFFYYKNLTIADIYALRKELEPALGASLVGQLSETDLERLKLTTTIYSSPVQSPEEEHEQRIKEFRFHEVMTELTPNPLLAFVCSFLINLLKELTICQEIYDQPNSELFETGKYYQMALYEALYKEDVEQVKAILKDHMHKAENILLSREASIKQGFLS